MHSFHNLVLSNIIVFTVLSHQWELTELYIRDGPFKYPYIC